MRPSRTVTGIIFLKGLSSIIAQTLLLRELLVVFYGNELVLGILLAVWLASGSAGNQLAKHRGDSAQHPRRDYGLFLILSTIWMPLAILFIRLSRLAWGVGDGEAFGLGAIVISSVIALAVPAFCDGAMFSRGLRLMGSITRLYSWEAAGLIAGGLAFTFFLMPCVNALAITFFLGTVNMIGLWILERREGAGRLKNTVTIVLAACLIGLAASEPLHRKTIEMQWRNRSIAAYRNSAGGNIVALKEKNQHTIFYDGVPLLSLPHPDQHFTTDFIHLALLNRPQAKDVLFIGTAAGGLITEAAKYPLRKIVYAETDPALIDILRQIPEVAAQKELSDPRLRIEPRDGRRFLAHNKERFEFIFIPQGLSLNLAANRYQTMEFFRKVRGTLTDDGIAVFRAPGSLSYMDPELKRINAGWLKTLSAVFENVRTIPGDGYNIFLASRKEVPLDPLLMSKNTRALKEPAPLLTPEYFKWRLDKNYVDWFYASIKDDLITISVNRDTKPVGLYDNLGFYYAPFSKKIPLLLGGLKGPRVRWIFLVVAVLFFILRHWTHQRNQRPVLLSWVAAGAGFSGMAAQIMCLFLFQSLQGQLFYWLALLNAGFMAGAALGALTAHRHEKALSSWKGLALVEAIAGILPLGILAGLVSAYEKTGAVSAHLLFVSSFLGGCAIGLQMPLVFHLGLRHKNHQEAIGRWAGHINGLDLGGACIAALLVPLVLLPGYGIIVTATGIILMRLGNAWNILRSADLG